MERNLAVEDKVKSDSHRDELSTNAIVALGLNNEIGFRGDMPWHIPEDLRHFKEITMGHPVIMGRATWESLPKRPLPGRLNIVISRNPDYLSDQIGTGDIKTATSIDEAIALCSGMPEPFIIGGGRVYNDCMSMVNRLYVTEIQESFPEADTFFPEIDPAKWKLIDQSEIKQSVKGLSYRFKTYERCDNK